ncbi:hypothetical protein [Marasmitruncus massiliensis]|uniref:hypothetical protein n=1 Tax=Marasmitruncus massiliensis TaxID=1944642 RepID=UPI000C7C6BFF|nr:hypothetical protein [Marasmitruncus massiliensis]
MNLIRKRLTSIALAAVMTVSTAVVASAAAAPLPYGVSVSGKNLSLTKNSKAVASYTLKTADLSLTSGKTGSLLLCFTDSTGKSRAISLGSQTALTLEGKLDSLSVQKALDDGVAVSLGTTADVAKFIVSSPNQIAVSGKVSAMTLSAAAKVTVKKGASVAKTVKSDSKATVTVEKGTTAAPAAVSKPTTSTSKTTSGSSSNIRLKIDPIEGDEGDRLMDLVDELNSNVYAYDAYTDDIIDGKCTWNNSRYAEVDDDDESYSFTFTPDDDDLAPIKGKITIYVKGAFGDVTLQIGTIKAQEGDKLSDLKDELEDAVEALDDNGDIVDGTFKWDSSGSTEVREDHSYGFTFKPKKSSRYDSEDGSIKIVFEDKD